MVDGAEAVGDAVLGAMSHEQQVPVAERRVALGAGGHAVGSRGLWWKARLPVRALDRPGNDVLEAAEDGAPLAGVLDQPEPVPGLDRVAAPGAALPFRAQPRALVLSDRFSRMPEPPRIIVLEGDQTGQELLDQALRLLDPGVCRVELEFDHYDLSLENRRRTGNEVVTAAARAMRETGYGVKAATITPEGADDVGSPNRILREEIDGKVIIRTGRRIPGVTPVAGIHHPIAVVRMAVEDAYGAEERREPEDGDEVAYRIERVHRSICRAVAEYAFETAQRMHARVYGGPKWTVSPRYEGMLKEEMDAASERHRDVPYQPQLIDVTFAGLVGGAGADSPLVIPALNRDGDSLSELVLGLFGSIAGAESVLLSFDSEYRTRVVMTEAPHGTAPALEGKDIANPMAMILAVAALLRYIGERERNPAAGTASRAIYESVLEASAAGIRTPDLGGHASTSEFTSEVVARVRTKLEIWSTLEADARAS
jgi:3-isopropylmalate dehydrogenase